MSMYTSSSLTIRQARGGGSTQHQHQMAPSMISSISRVCNYATRALSAQMECHYKLPYKGAGACCRFCNSCVAANACGLA